MCLHTSNGRGIFMDGICMDSSDSKKPLSCSEQLDLLCGRGMTVNDRPMSQRCLQHVNYHRLAEYWWIFAGADRQFRAGTSFEDVLAVYNLDRKLRMLLFDAIGIIEVSLRANFSHCLASRHGHDAHLQKGLSHNPRRWETAHDRLVQQIKRHQKVSIRPQSPIWEITEVISLGLLSMMYKNLKHESRNEIARIYCLEGAVLETWLHNLTHLRNLCSHHCRLWNRRIPAIAERPRKVSVLRERWNPDSGRIYNSLLVIGYLLGRMPLQSEWNVLIGKLLDEFPEGYPERHMGFPGNWKHEHICDWQSC